MFYQGLHIAYAVLLCAALWLNRADWRTFVLSLVVAAGVFVPVPWTDNPVYWYLQCFLIELLVLFSAVVLRSPASWGVIAFSAGLASMHLTGALLGPDVGAGPYRITVPLLESAELINCIALSFSIRNLIQRRIVLALYSGADHG